MQNGQFDVKKPTARSRWKWMSYAREDEGERRGPHGGVVEVINECVKDNPSTSIPDLARELEAPMWQPWRWTWASARRVQLLPPAGCRKWLSKATYVLNQLKRAKHPWKSASLTKRIFTWIRLQSHGRGFFYRWRLVLPRGSEVFLPICSQSYTTEMTIERKVKKRNITVDLVNIVLVKCLNLVKISLLTHFVQQKKHQVSGFS